MVKIYNAFRPEAKPGTITVEYYRNGFLTFDTYSNFVKVYGHKYDEEIISFLGSAI